MFLRNFWPSLRCNNSNLYFLFVGKFDQFFFETFLKQKYIYFAWKFILLLNAWSSLLVASNKEMSRVCAGNIKMNLNITMFFIVFIFKESFLSFFSITYRVKLFPLYCWCLMTTIRVWSIMINNTMKLHWFTKKRNFWMTGVVFLIAPFTNNLQVFNEILKITVLNL